MEFRIVSSREEIATLKETEENIHLAFRPTMKDILILVDHCPYVDNIQIPKSYQKTISKDVSRYLYMKNITLFSGDVWGHRKDMTEYANVPIPGETFEKIETGKTFTVSEVDGHIVTVQSDDGEKIKLSTHGKDLKRNYLPKRTL